MAAAAGAPRLQQINNELVESIEMLRVQRAELAVEVCFVPLSSDTSTQMSAMRVFRANFLSVLHEFSLSPFCRSLLGVFQITREQEERLRLEHELQLLVARLFDDEA